MSTSELEIGSRPGLTTVIDTIIAPKTAFDRLRVVPTWGWAFLIATVLGVIGTFLIGPAMVHVMETTVPAKLAASPQIAKLPPDQQQSMIAMQLKVSRVLLQLLPLFVPITLLVVGLIQGVVMTAANAIGRGDGSFKKYFALSINVAVVGYALGAVVIGAIVLLRGATSFDDQSAITGSLPSLGLLAPGLKGFAGGFLGGINVFYLWATALLALGMQRVGRLPAAVAWSTACLMLLLTAVTAGVGAALNK